MPTQKEDEGKASKTKKKDLSSHCIPHQYENRQQTLDNLNVGSLTHKSTGKFTVLLSEQSLEIILVSRGVFVYETTLTISKSE